MEFRDAVKYLRSELGMTQVELAMGLNINAITVGRWENGKTVPARSISAVLLEFARSKGASKECLDMLTKAISNAAKSKLGFSGEGIYAVEPSSIRRIVDEASYAIFVCDMETDEILYLNRKAIEIGGADVPAVGKKCYEYLMNANTPCATCRKAELVEDEFKSFDVLLECDGLTYRAQEKIIQWNGRRARLKCIYGHEIATSIEDITKTQLRAIFENINGGVSVVVYNDSNGLRFAYANDRYYELFGYTKEQFAQELKSPHDVVYPEDWDIAAAAIEKVKKEKQSVSFRYRIIKRDKSIAHVRCSSSVADINGLDGYVLISVLTDITDSVELEQQAIVAGRRLDAIMNNMNSAVTAATVNGDGTVEFIFSNDRYYKMFGYTKEQFQAEVPDPLKLAHPDDEDAVRNAVLGFQKLGDSREFQYRAVTRDGSIRWIGVRISLMTFPDLDKPVQLAMYMDITDIVDAQEKLAAQHYQMSELVNDTPSGIAIIEVDPKDITGTLRTVFYNDRFFSYSGYDREEYARLLNNNEMAFVFDEDVPVLLGDVQKLCEGEVGMSRDTMVRCHRKDGGYRWLLLTGQLVSRRGEICVINIAMMDITDRQEGADRQRISDELLRIAAETDERSVVIYDVKNNICRVESRLLFSSKNGDIFENVPQSLIDCGITAPDSEKELFSLFERIRNGEKKVRVALQMHSAPDVYEWFECNATAVSDADGNPSHAVLVFHNITEQRVKEAVFKKWQQSIDARPLESFTLFRCNISRNASVDEQDGKLLKISFPQSELSFNAKTLLYADEYVYTDDRESYVKLLDSDTLLAMYYRGEHYATMDYREITDNGENAWRRLTVEMVEYPDSTDVQAFLMYEDIDEKKKEEISAKELAQSDPLTGTLNRVAFSEKVDEIILASPNTPYALLMLDMDGFKQLNDTFGHAAGDQALQEVADVLRSYTRDGDLVCRLGGDEFMLFLCGITYDAVIAKIAQQLCEHIRKAYSQEVLLSASVGISVFPRDGETYDDLYQKADKALYKVKQTGKGSYAFYSFIGQEHTAEVEEAVSAIKASPQSPGGTKRRMLIADDNEASRLSLSNIFKDEYLIETAKNGAEAMIRLRHFGASVSVVLLDLIMPGVDGFAVLKKMRADADLRTIPAIVVTGDEEHQTLLKAFELGAAEYVVKPVDVDIIRMRVKAVISKAESERLRAQNSYLMLQRDEEVKYRTVLESTGTVVIEYDWRNHVFIYDGEISKHIAGNFDHRGLWQVLLADMVADSADVKILQDTLITLASSRERNRESKLVRLKTPKGEKHWFRMNIYKSVNDFGLTEKLIVTFNDVHDEIMANQRLLFQATRDELTGLYNRAGFLERASELIAEAKPGYYVMACIDVDRFKVINDRYGTERGDAVLIHIANTIDGFVKSHGGISCRYTADKFAILYPAKLRDTEELARNHKAVAAPDCIPRPLRLCIGRCLVNDVTLPVSAIFDRAAMAKAMAKGLYNTYIVDYDESMRDNILEEQQIVSDMVLALENGEFEPWFQPQYNHATGALIGAEALMRWCRNGKVVPPNKFIPVFEKNGFIYEVDQSIWRQVCVILRRWLDEGRNPLPISVNISRNDMFQENFVGVLTGLLEEFRLPAELLRLEITESAFSADTSVITDIAGKLINAGFTVEIDDFGSGYSSLNTLKDVPASILKLDMRFFETTANSARGGNIIESVVRMAKLLGMAVIAEGVESKEQADYLKSIGCYYIQGYFYSKPIPTDEYEKMMDESVPEHKLTRLETIETLDSDLFWDPKSIETLIFNSYVGGACIIELHNAKIELLRYNDQYIHELHGLVEETSDIRDIAIHTYLDENSRKSLFNALQRALESGREASSEMRLTKDGHTEYIQQTCRVIAKSTERVLYYCVIQNLTEHRKLEQERAESAERLSVILSSIHGGVSASVFHDENHIDIAFANEGFYKIFGYTEEQFKAEVAEAVDPILPEDRELVTSTLARIVRERGSVTYEYRCRKRDGSIVWIQTTNTVTSLLGVGDTVLLAVTTDISDIRRAEKASLETADRLNTVMNVMTSGMTAVTVHGRINFLFANDRYYQLHGINPQNKALDTLHDAFSVIHPDDRDRIRNIVMNTNMIGQSVKTEYRINTADGTVRYVKMVINVTNLIGVDAPVQVAIYTDITDEKKANEQIRFLNESASEILAQPDSEKAINDTLRKLLNYFAGERTYIFELNDEAKTSDNTYEICAEGITAEIERLKNVPYDTQEYWFRAFDNEGFVAISDVSAITKESEVAMRDLLLMQNIRSIIVAPLRRDTKLIGYIGVDNPTKAIEQVSQLIALSDYIAVLLTRRDLMNTIERERQTVRELIDDTPGGFARMELSRDDYPKFISVNDGLCSMLGMTHDEVMEAYGDNALACLAEDDAAAAPAEMLKAYTSRNQYTSTCRIRKRNGELIWVMFFGRFVRGQGEKLYLNAYFTDISEQKSMEQLQGDLLENLPSGAALNEFDGEKIKVIHINRHYWELVDRPPLSAEEVSVLGAFHPDDRKNILDELKEAISQKRNAVCTARMLCGDGEYKSFSIAANNVRESNGNYLLYTTFTLLTDEEVAIQEMLPMALSTIVSNTEAMSYVKDKELRYVCVSKAVADMAGATDASDLVGKRAADVFPADVAKKFDDDDLIVMENRKPTVRALEHLPTRDGSVCIARTTKFPILDPMGNAIGVYSVSQDITAQKERESQLKLLTDTIPGGLATFSLSNGNLSTLYFNDGFYDYSSYTREEYLSLTEKEPLALVLSEDRHILLSMLRRFVSEKKDGMSGTASYRCRKKNGEICWMNLKAVLTQVGEEAFVINAVQLDITERINAQKRQNDLLDNLPFGAAMYEYDGKSLNAIHLNKQYTEMVRRDVDISVEGFSPMDGIHPDDRAVVFNELRNAVAEKRNAACDIRLLCGTNEYRPFHLDARITSDESGKYRVYVAYEMITDRDKELKETSERLKLLSDNIPGGIATFRCMPGNIEPVYYNDGICTLTGYSREEFNTNRIPILSLICEEDKPVIREQISLLMSGESSLDYFVRIRTKSEGYKWIECKASLTGREGDDIFLISTVVIDVTDQQEERERLRVSEELNRLAIDQSGKIITRYDVEKRTLTLPYTLPAIFVLPRTLENMPEEQIQLGRISPDTADAYRSVFNRINGGEASGEAVYKQNSTVGWRWLKSIFTTVFGNGGKPVYAVITFEDITEQRDKEAIYTRWQNAMDERDEASYTLVRCNLNQNGTQDSWEGSLLPVHFTDSAQSFNSRTAEYSSRFVYADDRVAFNTFLNSDTMLAEYHRGHRNDYIDYREQDKDGNIRWLRLTVDLVEYPDSKDVEAYLMFENINEQKHAELSTIRRAETDPLTGVLNRTTFAERVNQVIKRFGTQTHHALFMVDVDSFKQINDIFGHGAGDQALTEIADALTHICRKDDLVGRLGGDEFFVFLSDIGRSEAEKRAQLICDMTRKTLSADVRVSTSIGVALHPQDGNDFEALYKVADEALYRTKNAGKDGYSINSAEPVIGLGFKRSEKTAAAKGASKQKTRRVLIVDDNAIALESLEAILKDEYSVEKAADGASALEILYHSGTAISAVLLDLMMPGIDGFEVLKKIQQDERISTIPVIIVSADEDRETALRVIRAGASDLISKPVDADLLRVRIESAISKSDNERLRAQNSYLSIRNDQVNSYRAVLERLGTMVVIMDLSADEFTYAPAVSETLAGQYDERPIWTILLSDKVADAQTVNKIQQLVQSVANDEQPDVSIETKLKTKSGEERMFELTVFKEPDGIDAASKLIMTLKEVAPTD